VPLSDTSVKRRIDEMGMDIEEQICEILRVNHFSLQVDKTSTSDNIALLMAYVRCIVEG